MNAVLYFIIRNINKTPENDSLNTRRNRALPMFLFTIQD